MAVTDEITNVRLACGRPFDLYEILRDRTELDSRANVPEPGDLVEVSNGAYHVEIPRDDGDKSAISSLFNEVEEFSVDYSGKSRLKRIMKFVNTYYSRPAPKRPRFNTYKGRVLDLARLIEENTLNSDDAAVLLVLLINKDEELVNAGFRSFCVSGRVISWGKLKEQTMAVKVRGSAGYDYLVLPSKNRVERVTVYPLQSSTVGKVVEAYESRDSGRLVMLGEYNAIFRKKKVEPEKMRVEPVPSDTRP